MNVNRSLLFIGIILGLAGFVGSFLINSFLTPQTDVMVAARVDILKGTEINRLPEDAFVQVPVQFPSSSARKVMDSILKPADLDAMRRVNGVFITDVFKFEPILLSSIVSAENPAAIRINTLALSDPRMMIMTIPVSDNVPKDIRPGDRVDLAVAVTSVGETVDEDGVVSQSGNLLFPTTSFANIPPEALVAVLEDAGYSVTGPVGGPAAQPTATPEVPEAPTLREPIAKVLVHGAEIVGVQRDTSLSSVTSQGEATIALGEILALDVVIPREAFEYITMAINGGSLQVGLLSPIADDWTDQPTLGASLQDLLDIFREDREALATPVPQE